MMTGVGLSTSEHANTARIAAALAALTLLFTALWLALLIVQMITAGPLETYEQAVTHASQPGWLYFATYINAALVTLATTAFFGAIHGYVRPFAPPWNVVGLIFVPVYTVLNLSVYLSQVTIVPAILALRADPAYQAVADILLRQLLQSWPQSGTAFFNGLAYAVLGIPSLLYGYLLHVACAVHRTQRTTKLMTIHPESSRMT